MNYSKHQMKVIEEGKIFLCLYFKYGTNSTTF